MHNPVHIYSAVGLVVLNVVNSQLGVFKIAAQARSLILEQSL